MRSAFLSAEVINAEGTFRLACKFAVIEETLQILLPVPYKLPRRYPGALVDGNMLPDGIILWNTLYTASHDLEYWNHPK